jgi:hypothetical protein
LEANTWPQLLSLGVKAALRNLAFYDMAPLLQQCSTVPAASEAAVAPWATPLSLDVVRNVLAYRSDLDCRRKVALFVCSSDFAAAPTIRLGGSVVGGDRGDRGNDGSGGDYWEVSGNLVRVMSDFRAIGDARDPEDALRRLLRVFPFLPIDAGEGADRVIRALAERYLATHPGEYAELRRKGPDGRRQGFGNVSPATLGPALLSAARADRHDDAESAVYILVYAVIMLNTDLHHPSITRKMQPAEFVKSTRSTVLGAAFAPSDLLRIYASVALTPLAIGAPQTTLRRDQPFPLAPLFNRARAARSVTDAPPTPAIQPPPLPGTTLAAWWGVGGGEEPETTSGPALGRKPGLLELLGWPVAVGGAAAVAALTWALLP